MAEFVSAAGSISDNSEPENDILYLQALSQYEQSLVSSPDSLGYPISPTTAAIYEQMSDEEFLFQSLLPTDCVGPSEDYVYDEEQCEQMERWESGSKDNKKDDDSGKSGKVLEKAAERFTSPVSEDDIISKIQEGIPMTTKKTTQWSKKIWEDWQDHRKAAGGDVPPGLDGIDNEAVNYWLPRFVMECRNQNGDYYTGGTLYSLCAGIQRYVREARQSCGNGEPLDIFKDAAFSYFRGVLNSVLKDIHKMGIGTTVKQAEVISDELEERLWNERALGDDTPEKLLDTLVFLFGLHFALRSGIEHRNLRPDMVVLYEPENATPYLQYTECGSKNNPGGLNERKVKNKSVKLFANRNDENRCAVRLFKKYMSLRPTNAPADVFYLQPIRKVRSDCWFQARPIGHNTLGKTVKRLCDKIGESGYYTNHSLRRTCATRLYQQGVEEEKIMSITGHRSTKALRIYKKMSEKQEKELCDMIQPKKMKTTEPEEAGDKTKDKDLGPSFNFNSCNINFHYK